MLTCYDRDFVAAELGRESADCIRTLDPATLADCRSIVFPDSDPVKQK